MELEIARNLTYMCACRNGEKWIFKVVHYRLFIIGKHMKYDKCHWWRAVT